MFGAAGHARAAQILPLAQAESQLRLKQACFQECLEAQGAFKDSMIHGILQFTLRIAFRCVLHRCESQEIRCQKLFRSFCFLH